jgi:4-amino-4-deoxy-L-arabinose transferase-like glycosyltransferase
VVLLFIPLLLTAFIHLWNPIGFPYVHGDEGHYMRRAIQILHGLGPQETRSTYDYPYDHPYFGQIFLASVLGIIGYPGSLLHPSSSSFAATTNSADDAIHSIEMLYMVPRVLMGILAVVDTFLIYKIAEWRYNRKVAFIASILFAVMPLTWLTRRIVLDSIMLPFILSSILFAVYSKRESKNNERYYSHHHNATNVVLILLSGIFLGLAIFTKIPAFTMIPLVGYLIISSSSPSSATNKSRNKNNDNNSSKRIGRIITARKTNFKVLGIWFIPVILIPLIWPAYTTSIGRLDDWLHGVMSQVGREGIGILKLLIISFRLDPVLSALGMTGLVFSVVVRKDLFFLLWFIPFLIFHTIVPFIQHFHLIPILPAFCFSAAMLIMDLSSRINAKWPILKNLSQFSIISAIGVFGLVSTTMLITTNVNSSYFQLYAFIVQYLPDHNDNNNYDDNDSYDGRSKKVIMVASNWMQGFSWIPKYVFQEEHDFKGFYGNLNKVKTQKVLLLVDDKDFKRYILSNNKKLTAHKELYDNTRLIAKFKENAPKYDVNKYPYASMSENKGIGRIEVRANY